jgi:hypothetical protein
MDRTKKHSGDCEAALMCLESRLQWMMERVDMSAIDSMKFRSLCGIFRQRKCSGAGDCKNTLIRAIDDAILQTAVYLEMLSLRMPLEGELQHLERLEGNASADKHRLLSLRMVVSSLDHIQSWVLLEYVEQLSHDDAEHLERDFYQVYKKMHDSRLNHK